ncbi:CDP-alcohol phosphatidyltransferase family protein [Haloprofundus salinisoli]|uniref:CDP-alcohol phosphatidyltransferase family protein n=1 Tax=Haloprofundus salinisoli TaxID=2876193 RepID=UPI001CCF9C9D|nr:CDP-alcohol phosphatidyltransferase family protein [Haloprofundus salinisoli]
MTLDQLRPVADRMLDPLVTGANKLGLTPDGVSVIAFGFAIAAGGAFWIASADATLWYVLGAFFVFVNGWLDLLDGALAREQGVASSGGDLLDHVLDRYADIAVLVGLAAGVSRYGLGLAAVTGVLMTSYLGTQIQAVGLGRQYGGLLGRADRLALVGVVGVVAAVVPGPLVAGLSAVGLLLVLFAVVGHLTALQRFWGAWSDLN